MSDLKMRLQSIVWADVTDAIHKQGYALVPAVLSESECQSFIAQYHRPTGYRKTVVMERHRFGRGEYKYFDYPLPDKIGQIRELVYPNLVPLANHWMRLLKIDRQFPDTLQALLAQCQDNDQLKPTPLILKYGQGGFNTLHQDLYGEVYFPMQLAFMLNDPRTDFSGGEFVLTQQNPRSQSKAIVLAPQRGDMLVFTTRFRPVTGARGHYRAPMKHGVSEVRHGHRHTLGIIFHDAMN